MADSLHTNGFDETSHLYAWLQLKNDDVLFEKKRKVGLNNGPVLYSKAEECSGMNTVAKQLVRRNNKVNLLGNDLIEESEVDQWLEFSTRIEEDSSLWQVLNEYLTKRVYLVEDRLTLADIMLYIRIHAVMKNLSVAEREKISSLSRWYDQMQHIPRMRRNLTPVIFHRSLLYS